jgi:hypothetical protein
VASDAGSVQITATDRRFGTTDAGGESINVATNREAEVLIVAGREIAISNPAKILFPKPKHTKLDLARYYIAVADGALRGAGGRPNMLVRYPDGIEGEHFYQKRAPIARRIARAVRASGFGRCALAAAL